MSKEPKGPEPVGQMEDDHTWSKTIWIPRISESDIILTPDEKGLTKELAIEKRAIDDGNQNLPRQNDEVQNETQIQICTKVFKGVLLLNQFLSQQLDAAVQEARTRRISLEGVEQVKESISRAVDKVFDVSRSDLNELRFEELSTDRDLRAFRRRNRLVSAAHYKDSLELTIAILLAMFIGESILNGTLLAEVMAGGWLAGATLAGLISAINILLGVAAGLWGWRYLGHRNTTQKVFGGAVTAICHVAAVIWNFLIAHFREAAELLSAREGPFPEFSELSQATFDHLAAVGPFGMASIQAWALLILGLAIHFYAAKEGWDDIADRYPDYKRHDVKAKGAARAFDDLLEAVRNEARDAVEGIEQAAKDNARRARLAHTSILELIDLAKQRRQEILDGEDEWVVAGNRLLKLYRDENVAVRDKNTAPSYFANFYSAADYRVGNFDAGLRRSTDVEAQDTLVNRYFTDLEALEDQTKKIAGDAEALVETVHRCAAARIRNLKARLKTEADAATIDALDRLNDDGVRLSPGQRPLDEDSDEAFA
ncbi:hypothetical protein [uncultured Brevundimonas sp.]|uniref:hypothetical protein n=1 Tax=uncultured Brevundimonas sp. TaxID=213418 RepID=UPI002613C41A|nr:hypothetical protein [uncultured Brevundimonas sp.]